MIGPDKISEIAAGYTDAWNSGSAAAVADFYAEDGSIVINRGTPWEGRAGIEQMAKGFYADVLDMTVFCDALHCAGNHVAFIWTFTGIHSGTKNPLRIAGWEEWDLNDDGKVRLSRGWYDGEEYARQVAGH